MAFRCGVGSNSQRRVNVGWMTTASGRLPQERMLFFKLSRCRACSTRWLRGMKKGLTSHIDLTRALGSRPSTARRERHLVAQLSQARGFANRPRAFTSAVSSASAAQSRRKARVKSAARRRIRGSEAAGPATPTRARALARDVIAAAELIRESILSPTSRRARSMMHQSSPAIDGPEYPRLMVAPSISLPI